jgi:hypothetical protein
MAGEPADPSDGYCDCGGIDARNHIRSGIVGDERLRLSERPSLWCRITEIVRP